MKGCSIMIEVIAKHFNAAEFKKDAVYKDLYIRTNNEVLGHLEELTAKLTTPEENDPLEEAMSKYPPLDNIDPDAVVPDTSVYSLADLPSVPTHLPSVPTHLPSHTPPQSTSPPFNRHRSPPPASQPISPPPLPPFSQRTSPTSQHSSPQSPPPLPSMKMPEPKPYKPTNQIQLPSPSDLTIPNLGASVEPKVLASWIVKGNEPKPSVLLLDVRPREVFKRGCIKHTWIAQIEPMFLKSNVSSMKIEERMVMNSESEQQIFGGRNQFDLVVYYDQNSMVTAKHGELSYLREAIYENEFTKSLKRCPILLEGGFDAWRNVVGERGIYQHEQRQDSVDSSHGSETAALVPVVIHHTVYDYFQDTSSFNRKQSMIKHQKRYRDPTPPLRGIFGTTTSTPIQAPSTANQHIQMPKPQIQGDDDEMERFTTKYPDIQPNQSHELHRRTTFIDNPYHGFTRTTNHQFDAPPSLPPKPTRPLPSVPVLPPKPAGIYEPQLAATGEPFDVFRAAPVSDNSFSKVGTVMIGTTGLKNLGNTCYMNSIIQCLSGTVPFARYFLSGIFKQHINRNNVLGTGGVLAEGFAELLRTMWSETYNFISPVGFREALVKFAPQFKGTEQHDSQEFLNFLLDGLHEDCNLIIKKPTPPPESAEEEAAFERMPDYEASALAWERYLARNSSVIVSLFQGQYRSRLTCLTCRTTSTTYNAFMSLSLPIPAKKSGPSSVSIYQCLDYFVKEEILDQDNAWHCPKCKTKRRASKALTLAKLPDILLIQLKRFSFDGPFNDKLETVVNSPMTGLDLSNYVPNTMFPPNQPPEKSAFSYNLYAVSNHFGSLTGGHYTACVRNGYRNEWHNFDDSRFSVCEESKVLGRAAYNFFYVRSTVK
ncbi:cysteine proteinase [Backusella circina FSU 941]|nr:cysteine proteinase [Backusella circina FSU 941]